MGKIKISPSLLSVDVGNIERDVKLLEPVTDFFHIDVMDGHFVPITFALEFRNDSGADFIGVDKKIIAPGCKFYLIGDILPQEKGDGTLTFKERDLVFKQDYVTKVDVTVKSLKNAYYIIPDLRDPQLKVGLTVSDWIMSTPSGTQDSPIVM